MPAIDKRCGMDISLRFNEVNCRIADKMVLQAGEIAMTTEQAEQLGTYVRLTRNRRRLSSDVVAAAANVDPAQILRIERGEVAAPQATTLAAIASCLRVPINDLMVLAGYPTSRTLPTIEPYLRAKYPTLGEAARAQIAAIVQNATKPKPKEEAVDAD